MGLEVGSPGNRHSDSPRRLLAVWAPVVAWLPPGTPSSAASIGPQATGIKRGSRQQQGDSFCLSASFLDIYTRLFKEEEPGIFQTASPKTMASYVDNSFRQAVMMNPAERTQQVRRNHLLTANGGCVLVVSAVF